ncbi:hypothetical protein [Candidatus Reidiella endopervernicosa]|uniref:Type IV pili twitching motility protein PilT n=1 Tax=Candidatus Reidiella endopervernicosa TaxID=2738883 RepID=A0A6N0HSP1_9GAMM|nr:hypothetical protein [Candidatus Reidiella endopervernicosa]QKQ25415.1 hypothetical protein HUE57_03230 [Candidatus Reidiella endopervernicosa]
MLPQNSDSPILEDLSQHLRAVISQRLLIGVDGKRLPAVEVMLASAYVKELIKKGDIDNIKEAMEQSTDRGMQTFDQALFTMYRAGKIGESLFLRKHVLRHQAQASGKYLTLPFMPTAPRRPAFVA